MLQVKRFELSDVDAFNEFIKTARLAGESPVKYNENSLFIFHDVDELYGKTAKLQLLHRNLRDTEIKVLESRKEIAMEEAEIEWLTSKAEEGDKAVDLTPKEKADRKKLIEDFKGLIQSKKWAIERETAHCAGLRKIIKEVEAE